MTLEDQSWNLARLKTAFDDVSTRIESRIKDHGLWAWNRGAMREQQGCAVQATFILHWCLRLEGLLVMINLAISASALEHRA